MRLAPASHSDAPLRWTSGGAARYEVRWGCPCQSFHIRAIPVAAVTYRPSSQHGYSSTNEVVPSTPNATPGASHRRNKEVTPATRHTSSTVPSPPQTPCASHRRNSDATPATRHNSLVQHTSLVPLSHTFNMRLAMLRSGVGSRSSAAQPKLTMPNPMCLTPNRYVSHAKS